MKTTNSDSSSERISRRDVIKWFAAAAAASQLGGSGLWGDELASAPQGYGSDPRVAGIYKPGDFWPLTLDADQRRMVTVLADWILPADEFGPAASAVRVPDFIDEWVSAPYPRQQSSRKKVLPGLEVMNELSQEHFERDIVALTSRDGAMLLEAIEQAEGKNQRMKKAQDFLHEFTSLCMGAYYGTPEGWKAIGYVGNTPLPSFDGPPQEVLDRVGVTQTVT